MEEYLNSIEQAIMFLKGDSQKLQIDLAKEMDELSANMEYEKAAMIRDRIKNLSYIQLSGEYLGEKKLDLDAIAIAEHSGTSAIAICFYRNSQFYGQKLYFESNLDTIEGLLSSFISMFYQNNPCPKEILISHEIEDADLLEDALGQIYSKSISIHKPKKGPKKTLLDSAISAAEEGLKYKLKKQIANIEILDEIKNLFALERMPERIRDI
jgi:excinuclease ABC subunit C